MIKSEYIFKVCINDFFSSLDSRFVVIFTRIVCSLKTNVKNVGIEANTLLIILKKTVVASVKSIVIIGILKIKTQTK